MLYVFFISLVVFFSCGGDKLRKDNSLGLKNRLYVKGMVISIDDTPLDKWTEGEGGVDNIDGKKYFWVKGFSRSRRMDIARKNAIKNAQSRIAETMNILVANQYASAWESLGSDDDENIESVSQGIISTRSKVNISGLELAKGIRRQVAYVDEVSNNGKLQKLSNPQWEYYVKMILPYDEYVNYRDNLKSNFETKVNDRQKKLIEKADNALKKLDNNTDNFSVLN